MRNQVDSNVDRIDEFGRAVSTYGYVGSSEGNRFDQGRETGRPQRRGDSRERTKCNSTGCLLSATISYLLTSTIDNESGSRSRDFIYGPSSDNHANKPTHKVIIKGLSAQTTELAVDYTHSAI